MASMKKIRICHTLNTFEIGGAETVALDLARSHDADRFEVEVAAFIEGSGTGTSAMRTRFEAAGVRTFAIDQPRYKSPLALLRIARFLRSRRYDIIHGHNRGSDYWGARIGEMVGIPHRFWTRHLVYQDFTPKQIRRYRTLAGTVDGVIAVSESVRSACLETEGIPAGKVTTIVNGIDTDKYAPLDLATRRRVREGLGLHPDQRMLLFVGRFNSQKAPDLFIRAVAKVASHGQPVRGFLCGYGPMEDELRRLAAATPDSVTILGMRSDIPDLLGACDLFVSTSRNEGLPLNLMEAMASACEFLAPDISQVRELTGGDVRLEARLAPAPEPDTPLTDEMVTAWADAVERFAVPRLEDELVGTVGRDVIARNFSLRSMVSRYEELYLQAMAR